MPFVIINYEKQSWEKEENNKIWKKNNFFSLYLFSLLNKNDKMDLKFKKNLKLNFNFRYRFKRTLNKQKEETQSEL